MEPIETDIDIEAFEIVSSLVIDELINLKKYYSSMKKNHKENSSIRQVLQVIVKAPERKESILNSLEFSEFLIVRKLVHFLFKEYYFFSQKCFI